MVVSSVSKSAGAAVLGLGGLVLALVMGVVRPHSRGDVDRVLLLLLLLLLLVVAASEMPSLAERCHLGPVVLGDVLALPPAALALPAAAVAGRDVPPPPPFPPSANATPCPSAASDTFFTLLGAPLKSASSRLAASRSWGYSYLPSK